MYQTYAMALKPGFRETNTKQFEQFYYFEYGAPLPQLAKSCKVSKTLQLLVHNSLKIGQAVETVQR